MSSTALLDHAPPCQLDAHATPLERLVERSRHLRYRGWYLDAWLPGEVDLDAWVAAQGHRLDPRGIVMVRYGRRYQYNPLAIASQALVCYGNALSAGDDERRRRAVVQWSALSRHFVETGVDRRGFAVWTYDFAYDDLPPGWTSCLSQCCVMDMLLKYHELTGEAVYRELALAAYRALLVDVADGGVASVDEQGHAWLQEYAGSRRRRDVLNGMLSSVLLVLNNRELLGESLSTEHLASWIETLRRAVAPYTRRRRLDYGRGGGATPAEYLPQMIAQLRRLDEYAPCPEFRRYADVWQNLYLQNARRRWLWTRLQSLRRRLGRWGEPHGRSIS